MSADYYENFKSGSDRIDDNILIYKNANGELHRKYKPAVTKYWLVGKDSKGRQVRRHCEKLYFVDGLLHRARAPAYIHYDWNGNKISESHYSNDKEHRISGPAIIHHADYFSTEAEWYLDGQFYFQKERHGPDSWQGFWDWMVENSIDAYNLTVGDWVAIKLMLSD
jgi:hypothetical protein